MAEVRSDIPGEEIYRIPIGSGMYTSELASNIPDGFVAKAFNTVATGDSLENRSGIRQGGVDLHYTAGVESGINSNIKQLLSGVDRPILGWGHQVGGTSYLNLIRDQSGGGGDGFMQTTVAAAVTGLCAYNDTVYVSLLDASRVHKISAYNWTADTVTLTSIVSAASVPSLYSIFVFKDRMWGVSGNRLYFTSVAAVGGQPEQWAVTSYVVFNGSRGSAKIRCIVPMSNKLLVFTESGAFSLLVEGEPGSWILRVLDARSSVSSENCGFESKGIVYYADSEGVWATNGSSIAKLSGVIEDQFFLSKGRRIHTLCPYEDGMILSITRQTTAGNADCENSKVFYTKLDPVGWTEWNIDPGDGTTNAFGTNRMVQVLSTSPKVRNLLNSEPLVYVIVGVSDSTEAVGQVTRYGLYVFDGSENQLYNRAGTKITAPVSCVIKTKYFDAGNPYSSKQNKHAYVEMFTSDSMHILTTSWDIDATTSVGTVVRETPTQDFTVGQTSNLLRIPSEFPFRRCALTLKTSLQSATSQVKIKDLAIVYDAMSDVKERVQ